jgi:iron(II)-dependent oxidoreductase
LPAYRIGIYPVTNTQYEEFVRDTHRSVASEMGWDGLKVPAGLEKLPVTGVTWYDAMDYCQWLSEKTARKYSLPNEAQWEKACRGGKQSTYPWGDEFDSERCNYGKPTLASVYAYPVQNEYGCFDLVGNVRQWTSTLWGGKLIAPDPRYVYPWKEDGRNDINASRQVRRVMRGSSTQEDVMLLRCSARSGQIPDNIGSTNGFRVVMNI